MFKNDMVSLCVSFLCLTNISMSVGKAPVIDAWSLLPKNVNILLPSSFFLPTLSILSSLLFFIAILLYVIFNSLVISFMSCSFLPNVPRIMEPTLFFDTSFSRTLNSRIS